MRSFPRLLMYALLWALAIIASSYFLRGRAAGDWVDAFLYLGAGLWYGNYVLRPPCMRQA